MLRLALLLISLTSGASMAAAVPVPPALQPFLDRHCLDCHDGEVKKGGLDLTALPWGGDDPAAHKKWVRIFDRVTAGEMPPAKKERPATDELRGFLGKLGTDLTSAHSSGKGTVLRRLNRREYQNTIEDLLGVQVNVLSTLPEDGRAHGFDNVGEALAVSGIQMQRYMEAAETALNAALLQDSRPVPEKVAYTLEHERNRDFPGKQWLKRPDGAMVVFNNGGYPSTQLYGFRAKASGMYRVRMTGYGYQIAEPVPFALVVGSFDRGADTSIHSFHELPPDKSATVEAMLHLRAGDSLKITPQGLNGPDGHSPIKDGPDKYPGEGLAIQSVEVEGPLVEQWPPRGQSLLLGNVTLREVPPEKPWMRQQRNYKPRFAATTSDPHADSRRGLRNFAAAAFRRPVSTADCEPFFTLFDAEFAVSSDYLEALRAAAIAILCSPDFLFLKESPGQLTDHQLAARLSYFLTRSPPDAALLDLADARELAKPETLRAQTERLLAGARLHRFIGDFTDSWLNLRDIDFTTPDKQLYPEYDDLLLDSMLRETRAFIAELVINNQGLANLIDSDFAMLNSRLARHYGIPDVAGVHIRRVALPPNSLRGGLLAQASVLKVSANGTNTSPVIRGVWVAERLLGIESSPPPAGIPGVEPDIRGASTMREILDKHRSTESCNSCHRVIDPPGFALESFDVIGGWRDRFRSIEKGDSVDLRVDGRRVRYRLGPAVDASGELSSGARFNDFADFQRLLLHDEDRVARCVAEKLLIFATGREMGFSDRAEIDRLVGASKRNGHGLRDLIHAIIQSPLFLQK